MKDKLQTSCIYSYTRATIVLGLCGFHFRSDTLYYS